MRFSWNLVTKLGWHLARSRLKGARRTPLVLMLEPLFACNLTCQGCGRIREYAGFAHEKMSLENCLAAARECDAPVVSLCGGEPLLYPKIDELVDGLLAQNRFVYLCTNGLLIARWLHRLPRSPRLVWNIHLDGMEQTHDLLTGRPGTFQEATRAIRLLKEAGMRVTTNTTIYAQTDMHEVIVLLEYLTELGVDGMLLSPAYPYSCFQSDSVSSSPSTLDHLTVASIAEADLLRQGTSGHSKPQSNLESGLRAQHPTFLTRKEIIQQFTSIERELRRFRLINSPIYLELLLGRRELPCAAWASPTRNVCGWKSPCYLITDSHYNTFREWQEQTPWDKIGPGKDPRCENCLVHYGFETGAVFAAQKSLRDSLALALWQLRG